MTYQFNIQLKGITKPPVWRRVLVPDTYDFLDKFSRQKTIGASKTKLKSFFTDRAIQKMCYIYDFGDNWTHIITLEDVLEEQREKADCVTGNGACPPSCPVNFARQ